MKPPEQSNGGKKMLDFEIAKELEEMVFIVAQKEVSAAYIAQYAKKDADSSCKPGYEIWHLTVCENDGSGCDDVSCQITIILNTKDPSKSIVKGYFINPNADDDCLSWM